ncbi:HGxxPAAW family protein [Streptomyces sp. NPDC092296]|uniref:HGxxPAAW family protein n=1 Tax=Streptomyces sp. NPDC092296 TaxID=3366012 RepID=UPI0038184B36
MSAAAHGHTPAAWTGVIIAFIGFIVAGMAVVAATVWLFWVGIGLTVLALVVGKVMQLAGLGQQPRTSGAR